MAAYHGNEEIVEYLVLHGADTDLETEVSDFCIVEKLRWPT